MTPVNPTNKSILLLDPDSENRTFLKESLLPRGFKIHEAEDCVQALEILKTEVISMIVIDLELSSEERKGFMAVVQGEEYGNPGVFLLVSASSMTREEAYDLGAIGTMSKPVEASHLAARLESHFLPAPIRWRNKIEAKRPRHRVALSLDTLKLGRGGFSINTSPEQEIFEGESVEFNVEVNDTRPWRLKGTGIVRYVKLDKKSRRQKAWGIEFESLDDTSLADVMHTIESGRPASYIPRSM